MSLDKDDKEYAYDVQEAIYTKKRNFRWTVTKDWSSRPCILQVSVF